MHGLFMIQYEKTIEELKNNNQQLLKATNAKETKSVYQSREVNGKIFKQRHKTF